MLTSTAFEDFRKFIRGKIAIAQYRVGSTWYNAQIVDAVITSSGTVRIKSQIAHGSPCTIAEVRLLNTDRAEWAKKTVNIVIETATTNLLQWFDFNVTETEVS